ncbi:hypothetical protein CDAR_61011 [Caerostris darwini]|uniref:Uncharacterized protein n=1 Tax=Caerostris darwini TaxID=1538125 RepID=A0AAV4RYJ7_9ARAC|nr:hypothetical protein CDAR_61011 [Caerostris darwini]
MFAALRHSVSSHTLIRSWIRKESSLRSVPTPHQQYFYWKEGNTLPTPRTTLQRPWRHGVTEYLSRKVRDVLVKSIKVDKCPVLKQKRKYLLGGLRIFLSVGGWK